MQTFKQGKTYCELCLDEIDPAGLFYSDGYTTCCNELPVSAIDATHIQEQNIIESESRDGPFYDNEEGM